MMGMTIVMVAVMVAALLNIGFFWRVWWHDAHAYA